MTLQKRLDRLEARRSGTDEAEAIRAAQAYALAALTRKHGGKDDALERRLARLEAARGARPDPDADEAFAAWAEALDRLAARKAAGDETAGPEIDALAAAIEAWRA
jgi:hypothetical protein